MASSAKKTAAKSVPPKTTALANRPDEAMVLVQDQVPDYIDMNSQRGSENVGTDDLIIPRLEVLQALSPAVTKGDPGYIPGAEPGDLVNSVTNQNYGKEVFVVPAHYSKMFLVWRDRKQGGGFLGSFPDPEQANERIAAEENKQGLAVMDTPTHICLLINRETGKCEEIIIPMPRTKAKVSRQWNSIIRLAGGDRFSRVYRISTGSEKNDKGSFWNFVISHTGFPSKKVYLQAEDLYKAVSAGGRVIKMDTSGYEGDDTGGTNTDM